MADESTKGNAAAIGQNILNAQGWIDPIGDFVSNAFRAMVSGGVGEDQKAKYPNVSNFLYKHIYPVNYFPDVVGERGSIFGERTDFARPAREDAWRMYLGLPQQANTFENSPYRPSVGSDLRSKYYRMPGFWDELIGHGRERDPLFDKESLNYLDIMMKNPIHADTVKGVMGRYKMGKGEDELGPYYSYYDKWNLEGNPVEGESGRFGRPFELYDRLYYDPSTNRIHWDGPPAKTTAGNIQKGKK